MRFSNYNCKKLTFCIKLTRFDMIDNCEPVWQSLKTAFSQWLQIQITSSQCAVVRSMHCTQVARRYMCWDLCSICLYRTCKCSETWSVSDLKIFVYVHNAQASIATNVFLQLDDINDYVYTHIILDSKIYLDFVFYQPQ